MYMYIVKFGYKVFDGCNYNEETILFVAPHRLYDSCKSSFAYHLLQMYIGEFVIYDSASLHIINIDEVSLDC